MEVPICPTLFLVWFLLGQAGCLLDRGQLKGDVPGLARFLKCPASAFRATSYACPLFEVTLAFVDPVEIPPSTSRVWPVR